MFVLFPDARAVEGFKGSEGAPAILGNVECSGDERNLSSCSAGEPTTACAAAGVTCTKSSSEWAHSCTVHSRFPDMIHDILLSQSAPTLFL